MSLKLRMIILNELIYKLGEEINIHSLEECSETIIDVLIRNMYTVKEFIKDND